jgi:peptide-methionine (S)-S-oxide reductase
VLFFDWPNHGNKNYDVAIGRLFMRRLISVITFMMVANSTTVFAKTETAIFAGGCFWCVEKDMDRIKGVVATTSGFASDHKTEASYNNHPGSVEAVKVEFDPAVVSYEVLVARFLRGVDVTDASGQFCDRGDGYTSAVFALTSTQIASAEKALKDAETQLGQKVVTPVKKFAVFTAAEASHQNYYLGQNRIFTRFGFIKQADAYERYRKACGRDARVKKLWGSAAYTTGSGT